MTAEQAREIADRHNYIRSYILKEIALIAESGLYGMNTEYLVSYNKGLLSDDEVDWLIENGYSVSPYEFLYDGKRLIAHNITW